MSQREHLEGARAGEPALAVDLVDVFVYVVVLNLFVEYAPRVFSETFTLSLLTAVLLKAVLEGVALVKSWVVARLRVTATTAGRVGAAGLLWVVAAGSKFVVLELVALVFGDRVSLGGFFAITGSRRRRRAPGIGGTHRGSRRCG